MIMENTNSARPVLSIGLLVSNRKDTIQKCLDSLTPLRKAVACELIITDTGCDQELRLLLEQYADKLNEFTWCDDFSAARNFNLSQASGEWYIYLDDDEWFVELEELIEFFLSGNYRNFDCGCYIQRNYQNYQGTQYSDAWVSRLVRIQKETRFVSKIHEYIVPILPRNIALRAVVEHYGYIFDDEDKLRRHYERNSRLLKEMIQKEPAVLRWRTHLAKEYLAVHEFDLLNRLGEESLALIEHDRSLDADVMRGTFYMARIIAAEGKRAYEAEYQLCEDTEKDIRNTELMQACLAWWKAHVCMCMKRYPEAKANIERYFQWEAFFQKEQGKFVVQQSAAFVGQTYETAKREEAEYIRTYSDLFQLKEQILSQVSQMMENGNSENAAQFIRQLKTILPQDADVLEAERKLEG